MVTQTSQLGQLKINNNSLALYGYGVTNYFEQETVPSGFGQYAVWYNTRENQVYDTGDSGATWNKTYNIVLPKLTKSSTAGAITDISMPYALKIGDVNINMPALKSANGYTRLPNGIIIQWGNASSVATVTFPTPFSNTNYSIVGLKIRGGAQQNPLSISSKTTTTATFATFGDNAPVTWIAIGY